MPRPREAVADAVRTARIIVTEEGAALAAAASSGDHRARSRPPAAISPPAIAQAILDAERDAVSSGSPWPGTRTARGILP